MSIKAFIQDIVVSITNAARGISQAGFGKPLILGEVAIPYTLTIGSLTYAALTAGEVFIAVVHVVSGNNTSLSATVTGTGADVDHPKLVTVNLATDSNGTAISTNTQVKAALDAVGGFTSIATVETTSGASLALEKTQTALGGSARLIEIVEASDLTAYGYSSSDPEYLAAARLFGQQPRPPSCLVWSMDGNSANVTTELDTLWGYNRSFFAFLFTSRDATRIHTAADWANTNKRLFIGCANSLSLADNRTGRYEAYMIHDNPGLYPEAAWLGRCLPLTPGSETWKDKPLAGITGVDYTYTQIAAIRAAKANTCTEQSGVVITSDGFVVDGEYIDQIRFEAWLQARIEENILLLRINNPKLSFDKTGLGLIEGALRAVAKEAVGNGAIAAVDSDSAKLKSDDGIWQYKVMVPARSDQSPTNLANRNAAGIRMTLTYSGAVHSAEISAVITL